MSANYLTYCMRLLMCTCTSYRLYSQQVELSRRMNINLGLGIGAFQGLSNMALNGGY